MDITLNKTDKLLEISVSGRIDATTSPELEEKTMDDISNSQVPVGINFANVEYISSAGLRIILKMAKTLSMKKINFCCFALQPTVLEVFKISGFNSIIKIYDTKDIALENI